MDPDVDLEAYIIIRRSPCPALGKSSGFGTGNVVGKAIDESSALRAKTFLAEHVAAKASLWSSESERLEHCERSCHLLCSGCKVLKSLLTQFCFDKFCDLVLEHGKR